MSHHVLILGGHGKIAQHLTRVLLQRGWPVTSIIRNDNQIAAIKSLGSPTAPLTVLVRSLEDVHSAADAQKVLDEVRPEYVVWSAGAGGKGAPERTDAIDRRAAVAFIDAAAATPSVSRFLLVSYLMSRRAKPTWWSEDAWQAGVKVNQTALARYYEAKIVADEALYRASQRSRGSGGQESKLVCVDLRPGALSDEPAGKVEFGRTASSGGIISRASVAAVAADLLAHPDLKSSWLDLLDGTEEISAAVDRVVREGIDTVEGEPVTKESN